MKIWIILVAMISIVYGSTLGHTYAESQAKTMIAPNSSQTSTEVSPSSSVSLWTMSTKVGINTFLTSQSNAIPHRVKSMLRLATSRVMLPRVHLGAELTVPTELDANYRLVGGWMNVVYRFYAGSFYQADVLIGGGLGSNPPIIHSSLTSSGGLSFWYQYHLQQRWLVVKRFALGIDLGYENGAAVVLMGALRYQWED